MPGTAAAASLPERVCALTSAAPATGATELARLIERGRVDVLSTRLAGPLREYWCADRLSRLAPIVQRVAATRPALRRRLGPFAFDLRVTTVSRGAIVDRVRAGWEEFNVRGKARRILYRRVDSSRWVRARTREAVVLHGSTVQYALRLQTAGGDRSPWIYSRLTAI